ncbi:SPOSA6832_03266 [Sporobolomyces salmonicolor]|uniref:SPOSA6832_03266-mRNA-1:cds n=1 Tax=Sporidiobolus salmonicolor TaxID=5005 RepID=A0A0D6EPJ6_SPOSA|nr:SPOSA6832_03266 [Sporobolomyces salmonicolor]
MNPNDLFLRAQPQPPPGPSTSASPSKQQQQQQQQHNGTAPPPPPADDTPKSKKDFDQERRDLELAELLDMMDDYKPIVSSALFLPGQIPDEVTDFYLQRAGFDTNDVRVSVSTPSAPSPPAVPSFTDSSLLRNSKRLLALAAQRFISSISQDAHGYAMSRANAGTGGRGGGGGAQGPAGGAGAGGASGQGGGKAKGRQRTVLTMEDLSAALQQYGVNGSRAAYYL